MANNYDHQKIEQKWQKKWQELCLYRTREEKGKPKFYCLDMFPYPSGAGLHVGHPKGYIATDVAARLKMMQGYNVLHPMGWDAFGLPAENFALKNKTHPRKTTKENIARFKSQLEKIGFTYDWEREINTTDPEFYRWTQWIFLEMFKRGLAYESYAPINWCPSCKTGLANEDLENGRCERCGSEIERRPMRQWVLKITKYADRLLEDLDKLPEWEESIKEMQRNWIGRSEGAEVEFLIKKSKIKNQNLKLKVFTTRPDTLFGCSYVVVAPEHPLIEQLKDKIENYQEVKEYIEQAKKKSDLERTDLAKEKTGIKIKGLAVINPVNNERVSVFVADYVLANYGTGAIMAVPAHDERDFEFALQMNAKEKNEEEKLKIRKVVQPFSSAPKTALLLHGLGRHGEENWFPWLKKELEKNGWNVLAPSLPHSACPQAEEWLEFLAKEIKPKLKGEVTIIGHSLGALAACLFLSKENIEVKNLILVAPATPNGKNKEELIKAGLPAKSLKYISSFFSGDINKKKLKHLIGQTFLFFSQNDPYILEDKAKEFFSFLSPKILVFPQMGHFNSRDKIFQLPEVLWAAEGVFSGQGIAINSDFLNGLPTEEAKKKMIAWLEEQGVGEKAVNYKLQDWVFSRQRYWGEPIPLVYCEHCKKEVEKFLREEEIDLTNLRAADKEKIKKAGFTLGELLNPGWVADENLPVTLPEVESYEPTGTGESPLANIKEWVETKCPKCGRPARRETNTMPQWAGSSWYYLRYIDPHNNEALVDKEKEKYWSPVDLYVGGAEHATRHLIYARFWHKFLYDVGAVNYEEPFKKLRHVGLILAEDHRKMSKRWGNVINPDDIVKEYGADTLRVYEMFMGPFSQPVAWSAKSLKGARRFLERVFSLKEKIKKEPEEKDFLCLLHQTILKVTQDIEDFKFNTAISQLMILVNKAFEQGGLTEKSYKILLRLLAPFAPHLTEELWETIGEQESIFLAKWPDYDKKLAQEKKIVFVLQVNGKVRDKLEATEDLNEEEIKKIALSREKIKKWIQGKEIKKIIFVPKKLINIVVK